MIHPTPEDSLAALREEIRRAGRATDRLRVLFPLLAAAAALGWVVWESLWERYFSPWIGRGCGTWRLFHGPSDYLIHGFAMLGLCLAAVAPAAAAAIGGSRLFRRRRLRAMLRTVAPPDQAAVLLCLREEPSREVGRLVRSLLRDLNLPTELTPAGTPEGSGAEVSGAMEG
jgi:hypothetical protein